jgi:hypothetical protein
MGEEENLNIRVTLSSGNPVKAKFERIKGELGLKSSTEVVRALISRYRFKRENN